MADAPRRVLMLAYFFPPLGGAGVQRALKFAKYLPAAGWEPVVVTTRSRWYPAADESLLGELAGLRVVRAADPGALRLAARAASVVPALAQLAGWPDEAAAWIPAAVRAARRVRADALWSTSAPLSAHLAALAVQRATGLPWVADFRDEWAANPYARRIRPVQGITERAEAAVRRRAARVVAAAPHYRIAGAPADVTIPNGVDPDDVPALAPVPRNARLRLVFAGTLYGPIDLAPVSAALRRLAGRGAIDPARVELRVVGNVWVSELPSPAPVELVRTGYVPHARALAEMAAADVLVAHVDPSSRNTPAKVYEYLATGRPLLCVTHPDSLSFGLVEELAAGWAVDPADGERVEQAIAEAYSRWQAGDLATRPQVRAAVLERYGRDVQARRLGALLDEVSGGR